MTTQTEALAAIPVADLTTEQLGVIVAEMMGWHRGTMTQTQDCWVTDADGPGEYVHHLFHKWTPATDANLALAALEAWRGLESEAHNWNVFQGEGLCRVTLREINGEATRGHASTLPLAACRALVAAGRET